MEFVIGLVSYFESHGFNCDKWRKSMDGTKAIVHAEHAQILIPEWETDSNLTVYQYGTQELENILNSAEWNGGD